MLTDPVSTRDHRFKQEGWHGSQTAKLWIVFGRLLHGLTVNNCGLANFSLDLCRSMDLPTGPTRPHLLPCPASSNF